MSKGYLMLIVLVVAIVGFATIGEHSARGTVTATVKKTERVTTGSGEDTSSKYLVYTDKEVFENTDSLIEWKFNSSDFYSQIEAGKQYKFDVYGWRIPFMSSYRNIVAAKEVGILDPQPVLVTPSAPASPEPSVLDEE